MLTHEYCDQLGGSQLLKWNRWPAAIGDWEHFNKELINYDYSPIVQDVEKKGNNIYTL